MKRLLVILGIVVLVATIAAWYFYKPVRVFWPSLSGVQCPNEIICIEDLSQLEEAQRLYTGAQTYVESTIIQFNNKPHFIFCKTQACFERFGFSKASAQSMGTISTVVGPKGWKPHIIAHEMVHHIQNEQLGMIKFVLMPIWFVEGMAYSLSGDPRTQLSEPWQSYRDQFCAWYQTIEPESLWVEAERL